MFRFFSRFCIKSYCLGVALFVMTCLVFGGVAYYQLKKSIVSFPQIVQENTLRLTTAYTNKETYEKVFTAAEKESSHIDGVHAIITAHHFLAAPLIARTYASVASTTIKRVILVSPDHFQSNFQTEDLAFTTDSDWDGLFGIIPADKLFIDQLVQKHKEIRNKKSPFFSEHGIYTEIPFIAHYFPEAKIVPLIMRNNYNYADFVALGESLGLSDEERAKTLIVISSDFSHHATHLSAQALDKKSIQTLGDLQSGHFDGLNNDCRSCIALLTGYLGTSSIPLSFHLLENKDATDFGGKDEDVTSYVTGYFSETAQSQAILENRLSQKSLTLLFGGDIMMDRYIRTEIKRYGGDFIFQALNETLKQADMVVANLEGPITDNPSVSEQSALGDAENYVFTFAPESATLLKREHISIVNIGNNHILNFKEDGVQQAKKYLSGAGVEYFGSPLAGDKRILIKDSHGLKVALVNYNQFIYQGKEKAFEDIKIARTEADIVILYAHWGVEYIPATPRVKDLAHQFIDAGADTIIGSHPHVVQEKEVYQGKTIYYSLGNFVFDQYQQSETQNGLLVKMSIDLVTKKLSFEDISIILKSNGRTELAH